MSYLSFNEESFFKNKSSFFLGGVNKKKKSTNINKKVEIKPIKISIKKHVENQLPESGKHNPSPLTPLKRKIL